MKLDYAITNLEMLTAAKEDFKLSLAQTSVPWKLFIHHLLDIDL